MNKKGNKEKGKNKRNIAIGIGMAAAAAAVVVWRSCSPMTEGPQECPEPEVVTEIVQIEPPLPVRNDGNCEVNKGEADPFSVYFDLPSCGFCGDGELNGPHETPETCPADVERCGNGERDEEQTFGVILIEQDEEGNYVLLSDGEYAASYGLYEYPGEERCRERYSDRENYCALDCEDEEEDERRSRRRDRDDEEDEEDEEEERVVRSSSVGSCGTPTTTSSSTSDLLATLGRAVRSSAATLRDEVGIANDDIEVTLTVRVDDRGDVSNPRFDSIEDTDIGDIIRMSLRGITVDAPSEECDLEVSYTLSGN